MERRWLKVYARFRRYAWSIVGGLIVAITLFALAEHFFGIRERANRIEAYRPVTAVPDDE
jgi:hypothetical protein